MINVSDFTKELFCKWYPHDADPTADEWAQVPQHFYPTQAIQHIKRARMMRTKEGPTAHPTLQEVAAVSKYKKSTDHQKQITTFNDTVQLIREQAAKDFPDASPIQRRIPTKESSNGAPRNIQRTRNSKAKRNKRK